MLLLIIVVDVSDSQLVADVLNIVKDITKLLQSDF